MIEYFDVVDKKDKITGEKVTKVEAHLKKINHRCVVLYLLTEDNKIWLQVHEKSGRRLDHSVGGHVASGEDYLTAIRREIYEEIGIDKIDLEEMFSSYVSQEPKYVHTYTAYKAIVPKNWKFVPNSEVKKMEIVDIQFLTKDIQVNPKNYTSGLASTLKKFKESIYMY